MYRQIDALILQIYLLLVLVLFLNPYLVLLLMLCLICFTLVSLYLGGPSLVSLCLIGFGLDGLEILGLEGIGVLSTLCILLLLLDYHVVELSLAKGTLLGSLAFLVGFGSLLV